MNIVHAGVLGLCFFACLNVCLSGLPFVESSVNPADPRNVALLREALMHSGISADGITLKSMNVKWEFYRTAYNALFTNKQGQECYLKWHVNDVLGSQSPEMPICENQAVGNGNNPVRARVQGPVVGYPWKLFKTRYKANFSKKDGQECFFEWSVNDYTGASSPRMPICENQAIGSGSNPMKFKVPNPVVGYPYAWKIIKSRYKAHFSMTDGLECFLEWSINDFTGAQAPRMPICENQAIGGGSNPVKYKVPNPVLGYPAGYPYAWNLFKTKYKAYFTKKYGQGCFLRWSINDFTGAQRPKMPICENQAIGEGSNPVRYNIHPTPCTVPPCTVPAVVG